MTVPEVLKLCLSRETHLPNSLMHACMERAQQGPEGSAQQSPEEMSLQGPEERAQQSSERKAQQRPEGEAHQWPGGGPDMAC